MHAPTSTPDQLDLLRARVHELEYLEREHTRAEQVQHAMAQVADAVHRALSLHDFFREIHATLGSILHARNLFIALYLRDLDKIAFAYSADEIDSYDKRPVSLPKSMTALVIASGKPLLVDREGYRALVATGQINRYGTEPASWLGVPLISESQTVGVMALQSYRDDTLYTDADVELMSFVSGQVANAIERRQALDARERYTQEVEAARDQIAAQAARLQAAYDRMKRDRAAAAQVQLAMLPARPPMEPGMRFAWVFDACEDVAGDMFNIVPLDEGRVGLYILDVSGHGVPAALLSVSVDRVLQGTGGTGLLRRPGHESPHNLTPPADVATALNARFPSPEETHQFFTFLYGILDRTSGEFRFSRAGHESPILLRQGIASRIASPPGPAVGIVADGCYAETTVMLEPGDRLILHTDGLEEASDPDRNEFGETRILDQLTRTASLDLTSQIKTLRQAAREFAGDAEQSDDITILAVEILPLP